MEERRLAVLEECVDVELRLGRHAGWSPSWTRGSGVIRPGSVYRDS